jgi:aminoglycoside phosphotransferase (APT) family kinase protein
MTFCYFPFKFFFWNRKMEREMNAKKPSIYNIGAYLDVKNPLGLRDARVELVSERNHLIYRVEKNGEVYCLRMINPESYRRGDWISMHDEYMLLSQLESSELGPKPYLKDTFYLIGEKVSSFEDGSTEYHVIFQEFVDDAVCFNRLKPLPRDLLEKASRAIARLNSLEITPQTLSFLRGKRHQRVTYGQHVFSKRNWTYRLLDALRRRGRDPEVREWALLLWKLARRVRHILMRHESLFLLQAKPVFNFDGAHCGNTYLRRGKDVMFLDWQAASWGDPSYTLVRFFTSIFEEEEGPDLDFCMSKLQCMADAYLNERHVPDFFPLAMGRFVERLVSDAVWTLWDYTRSGEQKPLTEVRRMRRHYDAAKMVAEWFLSANRI